MKSKHALAKRKCQWKYFIISYVKHDIKNAGHFVGAYCIATISLEKNHNTWHYIYKSIKRYEKTDKTSYRGLNGKLS